MNSPEKSPAAAAPSLEATSWMLVIPKGSSCEVPPMMEFEDGQVSGDLGCNHFSAAYTLAPDGAFSVTGIKKGTRSCSKDFMLLEERMLGILSKAASVRQQKGQLTFLDKSGQVIETLIPEKAGACE